MSDSSDVEAGVDVDPLRVSPAGFADALSEWRALNWAVETFDGDERKIPKRPAAPARNAKSNDASTWGSFDTALSNAVENDAFGVGFPCAQSGHPFVFIDVDIPGSGAWVPSFDRLGGAVVERSPSGSSRRVVLTGCEVPEWWSNQAEKNDDDETREVKLFDSTGYVTLTGDTIEGFGTPLEPTHSPALEQWLKEAWLTFNDEDDPKPWEDDPEPGGSTDETGTGERDAEEWVDVDTAAEALDHIDPDLPNDEWVRIGFALGGHFSTETAERLFEQWSRGGSKWDAEAERRVSSIVVEADGSVGISTLIYHAKAGGWNASAAAAEATANTSAAADGGTVAATSSTTTTIEHGTSGSWERVQELFDSSESGSTTQGYDIAANLLGEHHSFATIRETDELYFYDPDRGFYVRKGRSFIDELLELHIPGGMNTGRRKNIFEKLRARNYVDADAFSSPEGKVCVANGVLDLDTRELEPHSPDYYFTSRLQTPYVEGADVSRWEEFISEATTADEARKLEEFIGYCLELWHHEREKNLFIVGPRQSGKSTFTDTVQALFGDMPTVTHLTPQQIADTRFGAANLKDAVLNSVNDINATKIEDTGTLKRAFSGEGMKFERKFQDEEFSEPNAKHMFSANWLPRVVGQDESLYRRVLIVEFPNKVDDDERDLDLKDDLKSELPGILNRALAARDRLHEQGGFTNDRSDDGTRRMWDSWLDAHKRFLYTQFSITGDSADAVNKGAYYQAYKEYAGRNGYQLNPKQGITKSLQWVPEISVGDNEYTGLVWNGGDAGGSDTSTSSSTSSTQDELVTKVKAWVEAFSTPTTPAQREEILDYAEEKGEDVEKVSHMIDNLCKTGDLWKPADGGLRPS